MTPKDKDIATVWQLVVNNVENLSGVDCSRFRRAVFNVDDRTRSKHNLAMQNPHLFTLPDLAAKAWWRKNDLDPVLQGYLSEFENRYDELIGEFENGLTQARFGLDASTAYYGTNDGWQTFLFYTEDAEENPAAAALFPKTASLLKKMRENNFISKTHYSVLKPGTKIAVHCGGANHELRMHFGLHIPQGDIGMSVGGETRVWENGHWSIFDDTFPHEVWNNTTEDRYIIHCRLQHPDLSPEERSVSYAIDRALTVALDGQ